MRVIVYPHDLFVGGCQINAIDLAAAVRDQGARVVVYGIPGPLTERVEAHRLPFVAAPNAARRPSPQRIIHLARLATHERADLIHGYEWPPCLDAYFGAHLLNGVGLLCTVLSMDVSPIVPRSVPLIVGTARLGDLARADGYGDVAVIEPPIDTVQDHPGIDGRAVRRLYGIDDETELIVTVSRLALELKLDALERAIDAAGVLAMRRRLRLLVVGDGAARAQLDERAAAVNRSCGREVVTLVGERLDPLPYYAAADVVVGMGSSALRAMSMAKPVVVQGECGYSEVLEPETAPIFLHQGFWGIGDDPPHPGRLGDQIERLLQDRALRQRLGCFGRELVTQRFALDAAARELAGRYEAVAHRAVRRNAHELVTTAVRAGRTELRLHDPRRRHAANQEATC